MPYILPVRGYSPQIADTCWLAPNATIVGDVIMGDHCSVWFSAVVRGDVCQISIGHHVNIQDNATLHGTYQKADTSIGSYVSIGHNACVHGCTIHDYVLIGMGAIVMDHAIVESYSIVAAGAVVPAGTHIRSGELWAGIPARKIKDVSPELRAGEIERIANNYQLYSSWFSESNPQ